MLAIVPDIAEPLAEIREVLAEDRLEAIATALREGASELDDRPSAGSLCLRPRGVP
jgi:hypothetical protein